MNRRKKKFLMQFGAGVAVILVLLVIVLLQNSEQQNKDCEENLDRLMSADGYYEAVPKQTVLLGEDYIQVTVTEIDSQKGYEIPELFRCKDYQAMYWGDTGPELWIDAGDKGIFCYRQTGGQWRKYLLKQGGEGSFLEGTDGKTEEIEDARIPQKLKE